jgi:hypothetical protein
VVIKYTIFLENFQKKKGVFLGGVLKECGNVKMWKFENVVMWKCEN